MWPYRVGAGVAAACALAGLIGLRAAAQTLPLEANKEAGQAVFPVYEGWFKNADGSFTFLFGYFNRNSKQVLDVPVGPNNKVEPGPPDQGQPTHFGTKRGWAVFSVRVPKDFGNKKLTWTLTANGATNSVPAHLDPNWYIEPFVDAANKNRPPTLRFERSGKPFEGPPLNVMAATMTAPVGQPVAITVWATDKKPEGYLQEGGDERPNRGQRRERLDVSLSKFRGPGDVKFDRTRSEVNPAEGTATVNATFSQAGEYILRVQGNDETGEGGGGFQCCWTSAYVKVVVR
jgi:hypothetical protein